MTTTPESEGFHELFGWKTSRAGNGLHGMEHAKAHRGMMQINRYGVRLPPKGTLFAVDDCDGKVAQAANRWGGTLLLRQNPKSGGLRVTGRKVRLYIIS